MDHLLTAEELLAGTSVTYDVAIPESMLPQGAEGSGKTRIIKVKPLSMGVFQLIMKGAKEEPELIPVLMIKEGLAEPKLSMAQIKNLPVGLVEYIVEKIRELSGMTEKKKDLNHLYTSPLLQSVYTLAKNFGWTIPQINELTPAQIQVFLQLIQSSKPSS